MLFANNNTMSARSGKRPYLHLDLNSLGAALKTAGNNAAAIKCFLAVQHKINVTKCTQIRLTTELCEKFGIFNRKAKERGLGFWEEAGIFNVVRKPGKNPLVELVQPLRIAELASVRGEPPQCVAMNARSD
jgi:hypothetical protein